MVNIRRAFLPFLIFTSVVWSAFSADNHQKFGFFSRIPALSAVQQKPNVLAKKADLQWKQTGTIHYANTSDSGEDTAWEFSSRDTIIYDAAGNVIVRKTSDAKSGWKSDSLESLDSTIFQNGKVTENISMSYPTSEYSSEDGSRSTCAYFDGGKTIVMLNYSWDVTSSKWTLSYKDSIILSTPVDNIFESNNSDMHCILKQYIYDYDATNSSWTTDGYLTKDDAECTATILVYTGKQLDDNDSLIDYKEVMTFNSSAWYSDNLLEDESQEKSPVTGEYYDIFKTDNSANNSSYYEYEWDSKSKAPICTYKSISFNDSHKNDTLNLYCSYDTSSKSWDTSMYRNTFAYDSHGNNISTISLSYDSYDDVWIFDNKDVNQFAQINVPVIHFEKTISRQNISISQTAGFISFSAPGITGLEVYNIEGRLVASVKQPAASAVSLNLSDPSTRISSGSYIARLVCKDGINSFPLTIKK